MRGYWTFGVQYNGQCFSANNAQHTFARYGKANNCRNWKGGGWANDVYFFGKLSFIFLRGRRKIDQITLNVKLTLRGREVSSVRD